MDKSGNQHETICRNHTIPFQRLAVMQKSLALVLLYENVEACPRDNIKEAIMLLMLFVKYGASSGIQDHLTYALTITGQFEVLVNYLEHILPGVYTRGRDGIFSHCYSAAGIDRASINLLNMTWVLLNQNRLLNLANNRANIFGCKLTNSLVYTMETLQEGPN